MELIDKPDASSPMARKMTRWEMVKSRLSIFATKLRRKLPYLVWYGDEIDVRVTFSANRIDPDDPWRSLFSGDLRDAQDAMHRYGVGFDTGIGPEGRDWEWDFSLKGPISVVFRRCAERPERRKERPKPMLAVDNAVQP